MENAIDALKMAAAILFLLIALTVVFTVYGKAKSTADSLLIMQDSQKYLESDIAEGTLYATDEAIRNAGITVTGARYTNEGLRVVGYEEVISTIFRYNKEKYGVTIVDGNTRHVIARFDSMTESIIRNWNNIQNVTDPVTGVTRTADRQKDEYVDSIRNNIQVTCNYNGIQFDPVINSINLNRTQLEALYRLNDTVGTPNLVGAPWYGNEKEIVERVKCDIMGSNYDPPIPVPAVLDQHRYTYNGQQYQGKNLKQYTNREFIEITKELDNSSYYAEGLTDTELLREYQMPTIEIIYIIV